MKEKQPKVKKIKTKKERQPITFSSIMFIGISLIISIALCLGLVAVQNFLIDDITYKTVLVAKEDLPINTIITEKNMNTYFETKEINILDTTRDTLEEGYNLIGQKSLTPIYKGEPVYLKDFENIQYYVDIMENPIEISFPIESISSAAGGKIREGDIINLSMCFNEKQLGKNTSSSQGLSVSQGLSISDMPHEYEEFINVDDILDKGYILNGSDTEYTFDRHATYVMENLYVTKVLDSSGLEITWDNEESAPSIIVCIIEKDHELFFNNALSNGSTIRLSKAVRKANETLIDITKETTTSESEEETSLDELEENINELNENVDDLLTIEE